MDKCENKIAFGDDFGDNVCTFVCGLGVGHSGRHQEVGTLHGKTFEVAWSDKSGTKSLSRK